MTRALLVLVAGALATSPSLEAHHSFSAYYFEEQLVTITGAVAEFEYRSPHAWVHVNVVEAGGQTRRYSAEWANPNRLGQRGVLRDTLKPGDQVVITGSPGRPGHEYKLHLKGIERPADGWTWRGRQQQR
jgi:hypothetical protein